jgi:hypothetical protein
MIGIIGVTLYLVAGAAYVMEPHLWNAPWIMCLGGSVAFVALRLRHPTASMLAWLAAFPIGVALPIALGLFPIIG